MTINLFPGDELVVRFKDTDGEVRIHFDSKTYPNAVGVLYRESFKTADIDYLRNEDEVES